MQLELSIPGPFGEDARAAQEIAAEYLHTLTGELNIENGHRANLSLPRGYIRPMADDPKGSIAATSECQTHQPGHQVHPRAFEYFTRYPVSLVKINWRLGTNVLTVAGNNQEIFFNHEPFLLAQVLSESADKEVLMLTGTRNPDEALLRVRVEDNTYRIFSLSTKPLGHCELDS